MKLRLSFSYVEDSGWCRGPFAGVFQTLKLTDTDIQGDVGGGSDSLRGRREMPCLCAKCRLCRGGHTFQLSGDASSDGGVSKSLSPNRHDPRADIEKLTSMERALHPTHPDDWDIDALGHSRYLSERDWAYGGPDRPPVPPPSQGLGGPGVRLWRSGVNAVARKVLISDTASAPPSCAAKAQAETSAQLGVNLTINGLCSSARTACSTRSSATGSAPMSRPFAHWDRRRSAPPPLSPDVHRKPATASRSPRR